MHSNDSQSSVNLSPHEITPNVPVPPVRRSPSKTSPAAPPTVQRQNSRPAIPPPVAKLPTAVAATTTDNDTASYHPDDRITFDWNQPSFSAFWRYIKSELRYHVMGDSRKLPSWMISLCVHTALILILALIPVIVDPSAAFNILLTTGDGIDGEQFDETFELSTGEVELDESFAAESLISADKIEIAAVEIPKELANVEITSLSTEFNPSITMGLSGRSGEMKNLLLGAYGGTPETEAAVAKGLAWLAKVQEPSGSWSLRGKFTDTGSIDCRIGATAMALLAFTGAGNTHQEGQYSSNVDKGLRKLLAALDENGQFVERNLNGTFAAYAQAQATIVLCELYGMTQDRELAEPAQRAINYCFQRQDPVLGGWRYFHSPPNDSDLSVTGWYIMAIMSARMAGLSTDKAALDKAFKYLNKVQHSDGSEYSYTDFSGPSESMTAEGLLCRLYEGWTATDPRIVRGAEILLNNPVNTDIRQRDYYYWYYGTQTLHHIGEPHWERWNTEMRKNLVALQINAGRDIGSWSPQGDSHGASGGRLYTTCLSIYCLEVYYRHMPLYALGADKK